MPYKCSVIGCRSNYDSTNEKVTVFQLPNDQHLRSLWRENVALSSEGPSARVCIKHFNASDVETLNKRNLLMNKAVPINSRGSYDVRQTYMEEVLEVIDTADAIFGFTELSDGLEEFLNQNLINDWNVYQAADGICFYHLTTKEAFSDIGITFKILVNKDLKVRVFKNENEGSPEEVKSLLSNCTLRTWTHLNELLMKYQTEPDIEIVVDTVELLKKAIDALNLIELPGLNSKVDSIKMEITSLYRICGGSDIETGHLAISKTQMKREESLEEFIDENEELEESQDYSYEYQQDIEMDSENEAARSQQSEIEEKPESRLKCKNCSITFKSENGLVSHQRSCGTPLENKRKSTAITPKFMKSVSTKKVSKEKITTCDGCNKTFQTVEALIQHMKSHENSHNQQCPHCYVLVPSKSLQKHVVQQHIIAIHKKLKPTKFCLSDSESDQISCTLCSTSFKTTNRLKIHQATNCQQNSKKKVYRYQCKECSKNFITKKAAKVHMSTIHNIEIANLNNFCFICFEEFEDYVNHVRIHSCAFSCNFCGLKFLTQEKAHHHEECKHAGETVEDRPFKCDQNGCNFAFKSLNHLKSHQQALHSKQQEFYQCVYCDKRFGRQILLQVHARQHYSSFPCNYDECERVFKKLNNLKEHCERTHGSCEIYLCNFDGCGERFKLVIELKRHRESVHGVLFNTQKYFDNFQ